MGSPTFLEWIPFEHLPTSLALAETSVDVAVPLEVWVHASCRVAHAAHRHQLLLLALHLFHMLWKAQPLTCGKSHAHQGRHHMVRPELHSQQEDVDPLPALQPCGTCLVPKHQVAKVAGAVGHELSPC